MQVLDNVTVDRRAVTALNALAAPERSEVLEALGGLAALPPDRWPADRVQRLASPEPLYVLRAPNDLLVVFRRAEDGHITVLDFALKEMIERYFAGKP